MCILFDWYSFSSCPDFSSAVFAADSKLPHLRHTITPRLSRSHQLLYLKAFSVGKGRVGFCNEQECHYLLVMQVRCATGARDESGTQAW